MFEPLNTLTPKHQLAMIFRKFWNCTELSGLCILCCAGLMGAPIVWKHGRRKLRGAVGQRFPTSKWPGTLWPLGLQVELEFFEHRQLQSVGSSWCFHIDRADWYLGSFLIAVQWTASMSQSNVLSSRPLGSVACMFCMCMSTGDCLRSSDRALAPTCVSHIQRRCSNQTVLLHRGVPCHVWQLQSEVHFENSPCTIIEVRNRIAMVVLPPVLQVLSTRFPEQSHLWFHVLPTRFLIGIVWK